MRSRRTEVLALVALLTVGGTTILMRSCDHDELEDRVEAASPNDASETKDATPTVARPKTKIVSAAERESALKRAAIWRPRDVRSVSFKPDPAIPRELNCKFVVSELGGTTPKFDCALETGEQIRIKYGKGPELPAEVAATHLLRALGFGADTVHFVETLRCYGCPKEPFATMRAVELTRAQDVYKGLMLDYKSLETFSWATVERKFGGRPIASEQVEGWNFFELQKVDPKAGGAPRAHVDALRLMAVFLAHWDNKPDNHRLVCLSQNDWGRGEHCREPFVLLQDVGATFGPHKVDLPEWRTAKIWDDRARCETSMRDMPYEGATFEPVQISEAGRLHLAALLGELSDQQIRDLFTTARFDEPRGLMRRRHSIDEWVAAFKTKVRHITDGPACPPVM